MENHTHFLKLLDLTPAEIQQFLETAADLKAKKKAGIPNRYLEGKNVALIFEKTSTRTRCAFEVACQDLGMGSTYLGPTGRPPQRHTGSGWRFFRRSEPRSSPPDTGGECRPSFWPSDLLRCPGTAGSPPG